MAIEEPEIAPMVVDDPPEPELAPTRSNRTRKFPAKYKDLTTQTKNIPSIIPKSRLATATVPPPDAAPAAAPVEAPPPPKQGTLRRTDHNKFGLFDIWKEYPSTSPRHQTTAWFLTYRPLPHLRNQRRQARSGGRVLDDCDKVSLPKRYRPSVHHSPTHPYFAL